MKISYTWLKEFIDLDKTPQELDDILTQTGLEVEGIESFTSVKGGLDGLIIGEVLECKAHPNADKLKLTTVDVGKETSLPIVCGAPNVDKGQKVVVATVGTTLYPTGHEPFKIKKAKIRGEVSEGMICAEDEIGLGDDHNGILVLDTDLKNGTAASEFFEVFEDSVFEIGLTPNRADATSHFGVARDLRAALKKPLMMPSVDDFQVDDHSLEIKLEVKNTDACPRYSGITISGVEVKDSPQWLKNRLLSIGLSPINNIVDITNFVLHELGQPLHAFDADKIKGNKVVVQTLKEGSKFVTLDEKERKLHKNDLMICDSENGMCIAGVFGGIHSGVTNATKNIFLESAYFSPDYIRKTSQSHQLKTDASFRFERGTDPNITVYALQRAAMMIKEIAKGKISSEIVDEYPKPIAPFEVMVSYDHITRLVGKEIGQKEIEEILSNLDIGIKNNVATGFTAIVPPYRVDVQREADIIEEILRIHGYNNVEIGSTLGSGFLSDFPEKDDDQLRFDISQLLAANGFSEIITNSLTNPEYVEKSRFLDAQDNVEIENKLSEELGVLRQSAIFGGLEAIAHNVNRKQSRLKLFEFAVNYKLDEEGFEESGSLDLFITGNKSPQTWQSEAKKVDFHDLSGYVQQVLLKFGLDTFDFEQNKGEIFEYGTSIKIQGSEVAKLGLLKQPVLNIFEIDQKVFYAEINWELVLQMTDFSRKYEEISRFPQVKRDLSLVLDKSISFQEVKDIALKYSNKLVQDIYTFDVYEGKNLGENKKAYAISFILQDKSKTLTDKLIDKTMSKLMQSFESELGAIIRK